MLAALAPYGSRRKKQVAILAGYSSKGGGFNNALSSLRTQGYIDRGDPISITEAGLDALGSYEPLPRGRALLDHWLGQPQVKKAESLILTYLFERGGLPPSSKAEIAEATGYEQNGGGFNNALSRLRSLELIQGTGDSIRLSEEFFE